MSRRLSWSALGFARRVMMSKLAIFAVVEGRVLDSPFYDRLLAANPKMSAGYEVRLGEQISLPSDCASGGKPALLALHDFYRRNNLLQQAASSGPKSIVFLLDRDYDDVAGRLKRSRHVIYTVCCDVEAEVFQRGDLASALSSAISLTLGEAASASDTFSVGPLTDLANEWRTWIELCCLAVGLKSPCMVRPHQTSQVNVETFGLVDQQAAAKCLQAVRENSKSRSKETREKQILGRVRNTYSRGEQHALVKGKWVTPYVEHRMKLYFESAPVDLKALRGGGLLRALLDTVDFDGSWARHWRDAINLLVD